MLTKYQEFLIEKRENELLDLITEAMFILSNELSEIIDDLTDSNDVFISRIAKMFSHLDMLDVDTNISYFDITDNNGYISFMNPEKAKKISVEKGLTVNQLFSSHELKGNPIKIGRLVRKVSEVYIKSRGYEKGSPSYDRYTFTDAEIEKFVNAFKASYDYYKTGVGKFELVSGNKILFAYAENNYFNSKGTLGASCMRYSECQEYLNFYANNDNVELLVLWGPNEKVIGRALVWTLTTGEKLMDRVYYIKDSDSNLFIKYAEENKFLYKKHQNSSSDEYIMTPSNNYIEGVKMNLEVDVYSVKLSDKSEETFPYMDTFEFYYWETGRLRTWRDSSEYYVRLGDTEGMATCGRCHTTGYIDCKKCSGYGKTDCDKCDGTGDIDCNCDDESNCDKCDNNSIIKCKDCKGTGKITCSRCGDEGEEICDRCGGFAGGGR